MFCLWPLCGRNVVILGPCVGWGGEIPHSLSRWVPQLPNLTPAVNRQPWLSRVPWWCCSLVFLSTLSRSTPKKLIYFFTPFFDFKENQTVLFRFGNKKFKSLYIPWIIIIQAYVSSTLLKPQSFILWTSFCRPPNKLKGCDAVFMTLTSKTCRLHQFKIWIHVRGGNFVYEMLKLFIRSLESI